MSKGGKRVGAGRKPDALTVSGVKAEQSRELIRTKVAEKLEAMVDAHIAHAIGTKYLVARHKAGGKFERVSETELAQVLAGQDDGRIVLEVFDKDPSVQSLTDLLNRALGKPAEHVEVSGADGGPMVLQWQK
jgi:hypothetical protein